MVINEDLNKILKEMWRIDEKLNSDILLEQNEQVFFNENLSTIKKYYQDNSEYWQEKNTL